MKYKSIFMTVIVLMVIVVPVYAYTELSDYDVPCNSGSTNIFDGLDMNNKTDGGYAAITKLHWDATGPQRVWRDAGRTYTAVNPGSYPVELCYSGYSYGQAMISWDIPTAGSFTYGWVEVTINWTGNPAGAVLFKPLGGCSGDIDASDFRLISEWRANTGPQLPHQMTLKGSSTTSTSGEYITYSGSALPDAPVITDFTSDLSCYYPGQGIIFESNVSGEMEDQLTWTWTWEIYNDDTFISESSDPVETIMTAPGVGVYDVQLTVTNEGGTDFLQKLNMINVTLGGNCTPINNWTPFPTVPTVTPTSAVFPTLTVPPVIFINRTGVSDIINQSMWGNLSEGYRNYFDGIGEEVNSTVTSVASITLLPVSFLINSIAVVINLFSESMLGLMSYTTIPLSITARVVNIMPWEMQSIITAGLAIDALFLIFYGKG